LHKELKVKQFFRNHFVFLVVVTLFLMVIAILLISSLKRNDGKLIYRLDDAYIHMAMAKNFSQHGVWGITKYQFSSSSSSMLWGLLLSFSYFIFGVNEITPFILNVFFSILCIMLIYMLLKKNKMNSFFLFLTLLLFIYSTPLPVNIFNGMEHILQTLIDISFVYFAVLSLSINNDESANHRGKYNRLLCLLSPLVTTIRFEGIFLLMVICFIFILRKRFLLAIKLGFWGIVPIFVYGMISLSFGSYFFPNSVVLKSEMPLKFSFYTVNYLLGNFLKNLSNQHIVFPVLGVLIIFIYLFGIKKRNIWFDHGTILLIYLMVSFLHLFFAKLGWYRYDAYIVALGVFSSAWVIGQVFFKKSGQAINSEKKTKFICLALFFIFIALPVVKRGWRSLQETTPATSNIYQQQYQMGLFLKKYYQGKEVVANDMGAINYLADIKCLDLWGLANIEITKAAKNGVLDEDFINRLAQEKKMKIGVLYNDNRLNWPKVGQLKIANNIICGSDTVFFFAIDLNEKKGLIDHLKEFSGQLPKNVEFKIFQ
jgi:hypothetical protein